MMRKVLILAGEESGLIYAREIADELRRRCGDSQIRGYADYGFRTEDLAVMGFWAVLRRIGYFMRVARTMKRAIDEWRPDAVVTIDYPGMNLRLAAYAKRQGIRAVHVVCPQVWAWKRGRIPKIEASLDRLCCFFPFEPQLFKAGFAKFTGHPLGMRMAGKPDPERKLVALLPGSRIGEVERILPTLLEAAEAIRRECAAAEFVIPAANERVYDEIERKAGGKVRVQRGGARELLERANVAVVASGTATLEAAIARCPTVLVYRVPKLLEMIMRRLIKGIAHVGLANIIWEKGGAAGEAPMPELLQADFTAEAVARQVTRWLTDEVARREAVARIDAVVRTLRSETSPIEEIADEIW